MTTIDRANHRFFWEMEPTILKRGEWIVAQVKFGSCIHEAMAHSEAEARRVHRWGLDGWRPIT